ncbi:hypothetical protein BRPE64_BCDS02310 [Caballeronia insecticola]|uniref:Uncharacterized protein n=1 Tax=Caballeronia insecticola TaxID=758793 RepID=R4X1B8_9BURK|nr:hypothetical protein BRPE64_BCDS02310 [Caballeronia insecticola]
MFHDRSLLKDLRPPMPALEKIMGANHACDNPLQFEWAVRQGEQ